MQQNGKSDNSAINQNKAASRYSFKLYSLQQAEQLARQIAACFQAEEYIRLGLWELLINAIEHGNLGIGGDQKAQLLEQGNWRQEIDRRLSLPENKTKYVTVAIEQHSTYCAIYIYDMGQGFNWPLYLQKACDGINTTYNGRGIMLANNLCFDDLRYIGSGNKLCCIINELPLAPIDNVNIS